MHYTKYYYKNIAPKMIFGLGNVNRDDLEFYLNSGECKVYKYTRTAWNDKTDVIVTEGVLYATNVEYAQKAINEWNRQSNLHMNKKYTYQLVD